MRKLVMLLIAALIVMSTSMVVAQDYDANVGEIQVTPSPITAGETGNIYTDYINLSDPNNPDEGEGTFDIRILVFYQGNEVESFEIDDEAFSLYQTRSFTRNYNFANAAIYSIQAEIYTIYAMQNGWPEAERLDSKSININVQPAMTPPTIAIDHPSQNQDIMTGELIYLYVDVHDDDGDLFQVKWYVDDEYLYYNEVYGSNDGTQRSFAFPNAGSYEIRVEAEDQEGNTSNPDAIWYITVVAPNQPPTITTTAPNSDIVINSGDEVTITWDGEDVDNDQTYVNIYYDDNDYFSDGKLGVIAFNRPEDGSVQWNTTGIADGVYRVVATITDNNHEERRDYANGIITIGGTSETPILSRFLPPSANIEINVGANLEFVVNTFDQDCDFRGADWYMDGNLQDQHFDLELCDGSDNWSYTFNNEGTYYIEAQGFDFEGNYSDPIAWTITVVDPDPGSTWWTKEYDGSVDPDNAIPSWTIENSFTDVQGYVDNGAYHIIDQSTANGTGAGSWKYDENFGNEYTIEFRVKCPDSYPDGDHCTTSGVGASTRAQIFDGTRGITLDFTPTHLYVVDVSAGNDCPAEAAADFSTSFHNVKVIKDNGEFSVYLDGSLVTVTQGYAESRSYIIWGSLHFAGIGEGLWDYIRWNPNNSVQPAVCDGSSYFSQPYNTDECTIGLWHFDENAGLTANDASGNGHAGTLSIDSWETDPTFPNPGFGSAFSSYPANIESPSTTDLDFVSGSFTIECWVKANNPGGYRYIVGKRCNYPGTDNCQYTLCTNGSSVLKFFVSRQDNAYVQELLDPTFVWDNTWHHIAGVRDAENNELRLYVDGELKDTRAFSDDLYPSSDFPLMIGDHTQSTTSIHQFNGLIDEVRISNVVREFEDEGVIEEPGYFVHITDLHITAENDHDWPAKVSKIANLNPKPAFVVATGDLVDWGYNGESNYDALLQPLYPKGGDRQQRYIDQVQEIPIYFCPGNHDAYNEYYLLDHTFRCDRDFVTYYNKVASNYGMYEDHSDIVIFSLNSGKDICFQGLELPESDGLYDNMVEIFERDLDLLDGVLDNQDNSEKTKIVIMHHPIKDLPGTGHFTNDEDFLRYCEDYDIDLVLCGHTHTNNNSSYNINGDPWEMDDGTKFVITNAFKNGWSRKISFDGNGDIVEIGPNDVELDIAPELAVNYGTTVITHGLTGSVFYEPESADYEPNRFDSDASWVPSMAKEILNRLGKGVIYRIEYGVISSEPVYYPADDVELAKTGEKVIVFSWIPESDRAGEGYAEAAADALFATLMKGALEENWGLDDLHFIGHSRGTVVLSEVIQRLGLFRKSPSTLPIGINIDNNIQFTTLDAHPWESGGDECLTQAGTARDDHVNDGIESIQDMDGKSVIVWDNVAYSDNYWQGTCDWEMDVLASLDGLSQYPGIVKSIELNDALDKFWEWKSEHNAVHVWYHGTILRNCDIASGDCSDGKRSINPDWYENFNRMRVGYNLSKRFLNNPDTESIRTGDNRVEVQPDDHLNLYTIFNGDFNYNYWRMSTNLLEEDINDDPGWSLHHGNDTFDNDGDLIFKRIDIDNGYLNLRNDYAVAKHNLLYIPQNATQLAFWYKVVDEDYLFARDYFRVYLDNHAGHIPTSFSRLLDESDENWIYRTIDIDKNFRGSVHSITYEITNSESSDIDSKVWVDDIHFVIDGEENDYYKKLQKYIIACPVSVTIIDPLGRMINRDNSEIPRAIYTEYEIEPGDTAKTIEIPYSIKGKYQIIITPKPYANTDDTYSIEVLHDTLLIKLAYNEPIQDIPPTGYTYSTLDTGSINGYVTSDSVGLLGVPVDLYDSTGIIIASIVSDDSGYYQFPTLDNGFYSVTISTPLGYQADDETQEIVVRGLPHEVNFDLTQLVITPQQRSRGYWAHQLHKALQNKPKDYTLDDFSGFCSLINIHFNNNEINPVDFYNVPQPANQNDSLEVLKKLLHMRRTGDGSPFLKRLANSQLISLMLNVVSGKVSQTHEISPDRRTISQAITYCDMLVNDEIDPPDDGGPGCGSEWVRYIRASFILVKCNMGISVPEDMIPADVIQIAYRLRDELDILPDDFVLYQNYPNPFNPLTEIMFDLPNAGVVKLEIYNVMGQKVKTLINGSLESGSHSVAWDSRDNNGHSVSSGIYFYKLTTNEFVDTKKMILLK